MEVLNNHFQYYGINIDHKVEEEEKNITSRWLRTKKGGNATLTSLRQHIKGSKFISNLPSWSHPHRTYDPSESFIPYPKITFLIEKPHGLTCQICRDSRFELKFDIDRQNDSTFSILPCGHVAGRRCIQIWCNSNDVCPFCRQKLRYRSCGHKVAPRPITKESIHLLPRTLPDEGSIPDLCHDCLKQKLRVDADNRFELVAHQFQDARKRFYRTRDPKDKEELMLKKEKIETLLRDELHFRHLSNYLISW